MKLTSIYFLSAILILFLISSFGYYYFFKDLKAVDEIIFINSNLDNYRTIPENKGGIDDPCLNLDVCNIGNE